MMTTRSSMRTAIIAAASGLALWLTAADVMVQVPQGRLEDQVLPNVGNKDTLGRPVGENVFMIVGAGANITVQVEPKGIQDTHVDPYLPARTGVLVVDT